MTSKNKIIYRMADDAKVAKTHSVKKKEEKIINLESDFELFISISDSFETTLNNLQVSDMCEEVVAKLLKIQDIINKKIFCFEDSNLKHFKDSTSRAGSTSSLSICSEKSTYLSDKLSFAAFLKRVNCPFCLESISDNINLVIHLDEICLPKHQKFETQSHIPLSVFQILPNSTFKCNICPHSVQRGIKNYFLHSHSTLHVREFNKAVTKRNYSEFLYCSCCKIQVPNNYTQLKFHIEHEIHKNGGESLPDSSEIAFEGICCVYLKSKKFKCLLCEPKKYFHTHQEILEHVEAFKHKRNLPKVKPHEQKFYCEFCCLKINILKVIQHLSSSAHKDKEKNESVVESFKMCFYCGFLCQDLNMLSLHMKSQCSAINEIRKKDLKCKKPVMDLTDESTKNSKVGRSNITEGHFLVKGNIAVPELLKYFKKFGKINAIKMHQKYLTVQFEEESSLEDILLIRDMLVIDKVKIEVIDVEELYKFKDEIEEIEKTQSQVSQINHENPDICISEALPQDDELEILFQRVSSELVNIVQTSDLDEEKKIASDCEQTLAVRNIHFVGFLGCELNFPGERVNLYFQLNDFLKISEEVCFELLKQIDILIKNVFEKVSLKMSKSSMWQDVNIFCNSSVPHILCRHKETQRECTVTFVKSTQFLTNMLGDCVGNNDMVRAFCLLIRIWLSVQKQKIKDIEYALISLLVFFLISNEYVCVPLEKYKSDLASCLEKAVQETLGTSQSLKNCKSAKVSSAKDLFQGFLRFLHNFDFGEYGICLPIQYPVPRKLLVEDENLITLPGKNQKKKSFMYIMDPFLGSNLASELNLKDGKSLLEVVRNTLKPK